MLDTWDQRVRRDKIAVTKIAFPVPTTNMADLTDRIDARDHAEDQDASTSATSPT